MLLRRRNNLEFNRPVLKLELGPADLILEILAILSLLGFLGFTLYYSSRLPATIPTHFNGSGAPDEYGSKSTLWMLPVIAMVVYTILTLVSRIPEKFNYPVTITAANARRQYLLSMRLLRYLKLTVILMLFFISYKTVMVALGHAGGLGIWFLPLFLVVIPVPVIIYFILALRNR